MQTPLPRIGLPAAAACTPARPLPHPRPAAHPHTCAPLTMAPACAQLRAPSTHKGTTCLCLDTNSQGAIEEVSRGHGHGLTESTSSQFILKIDTFTFLRRNDATIGCQRVSFVPDCGDDAGLSRERDERNDTLRAHK